MKIENNKITHFKLFEPDAPNNINLKINACKWVCTRQQFNEKYQKAKKECEDDFVCDTACSFNPCSIAYVAAATVECTSCQF
jgi:hypothetical protein